MRECGRDDHDRGEDIQQICQRLKSRDPHRRWVDDLELGPGQVLLINAMGGHFATGVMLGHPPERRHHVAGGARRAAVKTDTRAQVQGPAAGLVVAVPAQREDWLWQPCNTKLDERLEDSAADAQ